MDGSLRARFDDDADAYDRTRPVCPAELFDDLLRLTGLRSGDRVLEIGCGTGQATIPLAQRGLVVTATELGPHLAAVAQRKLAAFPDSRVVTGAFEDYADDNRFDAVVACNSLHWIKPELRYAKPASLLRPGGALIAIGCAWALGDEPFWTDVDADYRAAGIEGEPRPGSDDIGITHLPPAAAAYFTETDARRYPFQLRFSADDYLANLATQSVVHALTAERTTYFLELVRKRLTSIGSPDLTARFVARLTIGRLAG